MIYVSQTIILYMFNLFSAILRCQLYLKKTGRKISPALIIYVMKVNLNSSILTSQGTYERYNKRGKEKCLLKISVKNTEHGKKDTSHNNSENIHFFI